MLNEIPIIYQIDEKVVGNSSNQILLDENFILKIVVEKINTSENNTEINLIRLITIEQSCNLSMPETLLPTVPCSHNTR